MLQWRDRTNKFPDTGRHEASTSTASKRSAGSVRPCTKVFELLRPGLQSYDHSWYGTPCSQRTLPCTPQGDRQARQSCTSRPSFLSRPVLHGESSHLAATSNNLSPGFFTPTGFLKPAILPTGSPQDQFLDYRDPTSRKQCSHIASFPLLSTRFVARNINLGRSTTPATKQQSGRDTEPSIKRVRPGQTQARCGEQNTTTLAVRDLGRLVVVVVHTRRRRAAKAKAAAIAGQSQQNTFRTRRMLPRVS